MNIFVIGLNHKTSPIDIRQHLAFDQQDTVKGLKYFKQKYPDSEFVLLSTCNRVELYAACEKDGYIRPKRLAKDLAGFHGVPFEMFRKYLYAMRLQKAVRHLMTVASSLDSMVVGENQIRSQIKQSYSQAVHAKATGKILNHLFHAAFATGKKVFTQTSIASGRVSVAGVAVEHAKKLFDNVKSARILVIGAGQTGELLVDHFRQIKCEDITVVNRTKQTGCSLASRKKVKACTWDRLGEELRAADVVVNSAAAGDGYLFTKDSLAEVMSGRKSKKMLIIDIAVPRGFKPDTAEYDNTYLYCIDDLSQAAEENKRLRSEDVEKAVEIICQSTSEFMEWLAIRSIGPIIGQMKEAFGRIKKDQLDGFFLGVRCKADCRDAMEATVEKVVAKILHCVIVNIEQTADRYGPDRAAEFAKSVLADAENIAEEKSRTDAGR